MRYTLNVVHSAEVPCTIVILQARQPVARLTRAVRAVDTPYCTATLHIRQSTIIETHAVGHTDLSLCSPNISIISPQHRTFFTYHDELTSHAVLFTRSCTRQHDNLLFHHLTPGVSLISFMFTSVTNKNISRANHPPHLNFNSQLCILMQATCTSTLSTVPPISVPSECFTPGSSLQYSLSHSSQSFSRSVPKPNSVRSLRRITFVCLLLPSSRHTSAISSTSNLTRSTHSHYPKNHSSRSEHHGETSMVETGTAIPRNATITKKTTLRSFLPVLEQRTTIHTTGNHPSEHSIAVSSAPQRHNSHSRTAHTAKCQPRHQVQQLTAHSKRWWCSNDSVTEAMVELTFQRERRGGQTPQCLSCTVVGISKPGDCSQHPRTYTLFACASHPDDTAASTTVSRSNSDRSSNSSGVVKSSVTTSSSCTQSIILVRYTAKCQPNSQSSQPTANHERVERQHGEEIKIATLQWPPECYVSLSTCKSIMFKRKGCIPKCWATGISETTDSSIVSEHDTSSRRCEYSDAEFLAAMFKRRLLLYFANSAVCRSFKMSRSEELTSKCRATGMDDQILHELKLEEVYVTMRPPLRGEGVPTERPLALSTYNLGL